MEVGKLALVGAEVGMLTVVGVGVERVLVERAIVTKGANILYISSIFWKSLGNILC